MTEPRDTTLTANHLAFHLLDWGGSGPPLVLLHGLASQTHIWDLTAPHLAGAFRVLAIDQRGHGHSDKPAAGYDFATVTADLDAILGVLGLDEIVLVGHSWGGNVAIQYAVDHPGRVSRLVLLDGGFLQLRDEMDWPTAERVMAPPPWTGVTLERIRQGIRQFTGPAWSPEVEAAVLANFEVGADGMVSSRLPRDLHMAILRALWEQRPSELFARVDCPVLLLPAVPPEPHDDRSRMMLAAKRRQIALAEERLRDSRTTWFTDTIHDVPLQRPGELAAAIREFAAPPR
jgi:pimeloyl-ACP methyl ester carboxylesterase